MVGNTVSKFSIEPFARRCLIDGVDPLGHILSKLPAVEAFERTHGLDASA